METVKPKTLTQAPGERLHTPRIEAQEGMIVTSDSTDNAAEARKLVRSIEKLQAHSAKNDYKFLAYLLEMARMEAVNILHAKKK